MLYARQHAELPYYNSHNDNNNIIMQITEAVFCSGDLVIIEVRCASNIIRGIINLQSPSE